MEPAKLRMLNEHLLDRGISNPRVLRAMSIVPRELFVPADRQAEAYADCALEIDCQQTISQPYIVALMTEALELAGTETVLEVGTGSGYQAAVLAELARRVVTIERHPLLSRQARERLTRLGYTNVECVVGDGALGWPSAAPYPRIIVTAASPECPGALLDQLADDGILVAPLGPPEAQDLVQLRKRAGQLVSRRLSQCRFVPLVSR